MNFQNLYSRLQQAGFDAWVEQLRQQQSTWFSQQHHGDYARWEQAINMLPDLQSVTTEFSNDAVTINTNSQETKSLREGLSLLRPWRKGPYQVADVCIDTEWRSDFKWNRVLPHLSSLKNRRILDVGCGNGYHCWRMLANEPELVIGIDPSILFNMQFQAIQHYAQDPRINLLPLTIQQMPLNMQWFDSVFSMGVLYHRKSPFEHIQQLKGLLKSGGELCLETLIIEGGRGQVLVPEGRYARMNNVWFLPSADELMHWLKRCGFNNVRLVDVNQTSIEEQRSTEWMQFESLPQCLDVNDPDKTVEGYPAPLRGVVLATK